MNAQFNKTVEQLFNNFEPVLREFLQQMPAHSFYSEASELHISLNDMGEIQYMGDEYFGLPTDFAYFGLYTDLWPHIQCQIIADVMKKLAYG